MPTQSKSIRLKLFLLGVIFFLPALAGWYLYHNYAHFSFKTTNHGNLVRPALHSDDLVLQEKWQIIFAPQRCGKDTEKLMYTLHNVRIALGKDQDRVALTLLTDNQCQLAQHDFRQLIFSGEQTMQLQQLLGTQNLASGQIYLVDPIGNVFMYYPDNTDPMNILKDMKKVLEVSQIG